MSRAVAAPGDRAEDPLGTALVITPFGAEHAVELDAVAEVIPFGRALPRVPMRMIGEEDDVVRIDRLDELSAARPSTKSAVSLSRRVLRFRDFVMDRPPLRGAAEVQRLYHRVSGRLPGAGGRAEDRLLVTRT
jgi:hypothetical protein